MQYLTHPLFHYLPLRSYSVLPANNTSALPSSTPTSQGAIAPESKSNIVPLTVGLTFGLLTLAITVLGAFYLRRRRRRMQALLDTPATPPPHHTPPAQGNQLSGTLQESELHSQPTQSPTYGSTLSPSAPTATAVPTASNIGIPESEMSPSHLGLNFPVGGSSRSGEVAKRDLAPPVEVIEILDEDEQGVKSPKITGWWDVTQSMGTWR